MSQSFLNWMANFSGRTLTSMDRIFSLVAPQKKFSDEDLHNSLEWWKERIQQFSYIPIVSFVGSLSPAFDFRTLKLVAERFQSEDIRCQFIICGEGSERSKLQTEMKSLNNVIFPG